MKIARKFTTSGQDPFASVKWVKRSSRITNPDGSIVFQMDDAEVPETWSQLATDIMVSKYFRKAGVPQNQEEKLHAERGGTQNPHAERGGTQGVPLRDESGAVGSAKAGGPVLGPEKSARQVIHRLAGCWRHWGEKHGYFDTPKDASAFYDEMVYMMVHQMAAPNSPQWFNTGLNWAYGITGPAQGHFVPDPKTGKVGLAKDTYTHPQPHACFIQSVDDDLVNAGGIMDLWVREARLFKYGSGTGTNFSKLRGENETLSGGGKSSGLMSWLKIGDRAAGAIKSGGTTRRAAKMVCLDMDHPDIEKFINWKVREEIKVQAMVEGLRVIAEKKSSSGDPYTIGQTASRLGLKLDYDFNGEAYYTVSGQNSNNSVRIPDEFFDALDAGTGTGGEWKTRYRTSGKTAKVHKAAELWDQVAYAAWRCADPGVQFDSTINAWHTCPAGGRISASNPCSEYMFLDNTACNLASINVLKFYDSKTRTFDVERYEHAVDLWTVVLEVSVLMASYPSKEVAELSWKYRTLGLGYANFGAMMMQAGIAYDSEEARAVCGCLTSILTGRAYRQSAIMASQMGAFAGYEADREAMLRVIRNHRLAAHGVKGVAGQPSHDAYENLRIAPVAIDHEVINSGRVTITNADDLLDHSTRAWDEALAAGEKHGFRNAQVTVIAPTGTIGLLMDCDTTGIEPDFALVKFKKLAGGGYFKIANASVRPALEALGYSAEQIREVMVYLLGTLDVDVALAAEGTKRQSFAAWLLGKGMTNEDLAKVRDALPGVFELSFAFNAWTLGDDCLKRVGIDAARAKADASFNMLREMGLSRSQVTELNDVICGRQTVEGAPHLKEEHLSVFDCASKCGKYGERFIAAEGHIRMMAAAQPFISGAISKTINLPTDATVEDIKACYRLSWELGLKANALYRDGSKLSQPLSAKSDESESDAKAAAAEDEEKKATAGSAAVPVVVSSAVSAKTAAATPATSTPAVEGMPEPMAVAAEFARRFGDAEAAAREAMVPEVRIVERPMRRRLPDTRASITHKFNISGHEGYLTVGLYEDGMPGELFITMAKEGSTIGGIMDSLGTAVSVALQYGVPVESLVNKFTHQRFEPAGMTTNRDIPFAKSLVDYIFRWMGMEFIPGYREANAPRRGQVETGVAPLSHSDDDDDRPSGGGGGGGGGGEVGGGRRIAGGGSIAGSGGRGGSVMEDTSAWNHEHRERDAAASGHEASHGSGVRADRVMSAGTPATKARNGSGVVAEMTELFELSGANGGGAANAGGLRIESRSVAVTTRVHSATRAGSAGSGSGGANATARAAAVSALSMAVQTTQADAPPCNSCGAITVRSATCYKCLNCGESMGCS